MSILPVSLIAGCGAVVALLAAWVFVFSRMLRSAASTSASGPAGAPVASAGKAPLRLAPLQRLLAEREFEFLKKQPGFTPAMYSAMRKRRASLFACYLSLVETEFHILHQQLRIMTLQAGIDNPVIARALVQQRFLFALRLSQVRFRLFLFRLGMRPVNADGIAQLIEQMRLQVAQLQLMPIQAASAA